MVDLARIVCVFCFCAQLAPRCLSVHGCVGTTPTAARGCLVQQAQLNTGGVAPPVGCPELDMCYSSLPCRVAGWRSR